MQTVLAAVGLGPLATPDPDTPPEPPGAWIVAAWARREYEQQVKGEAPINATDPVFTSLALDSAEADQQTFAMAATTAETNSPPEVLDPFSRPDLATGTVIGTVDATDPDGDPLSYALTAAPTYGTVTVDAATGAYTYTPNDAARLQAAQTSTRDADIFIVTVSDGQASTPVTVTLPLSPAQLAWNSSDDINTATSPTGVTTSPDGQYTYIANQGSGTVSVVDNNTNAVVKTITVGSSPTGVAVSPDGNAVYVTNRSSGTVSVIDTDPDPTHATTYNTVVETINVGSSPTGVAVSPDGKKVYVTNQGSNSVSVIDANTNTVVKTISVGKAPTGVAVSPDGGTVYVTNRTSGTVSVIDANPAHTTTYYKVVKTITVGSNPTAVAVSPDGTRVYVANYGSSSVSVIDTNAGSVNYNKVIKTITVGANPNCVAVSPDSSLAYVANDRDTVSVIDTRTNAVVRTVTIDSVAETGTHYVSVSPDGNSIYVTDTYDEKLRIISMTGIFENAAPQVAAAPTVGTPDETTGTVTGKVNFAPDADGDPLTYTLSGAPADGTVTLDPNTGAFTYTPTAAARQEAATTPWEDTDTFTVTASDGYSTTSTPVTVPISAAQPPPAEFSVTPVSVGGNPRDVVVVDVDGDGLSDRAYVANTSDGTVSVIDTTNNTVTKTIDVGEPPLSLAASPDGSRVYVANGDYFNGNSVSVIDTDSDTAIATIPVPGNYGSDVSVSPDGNRLYVVNQYDQTITVIDTDPTSRTYNTVISTTVVGYRSYGGIAVTPDGSRLYESSDPYGDIMVIDTNTMTLVDTVDVSPGYAGEVYAGEVAVSPDGKQAYAVAGETTWGGFSRSSIAVIDTDPTSATYNTQIATITGPETWDGTAWQDVALSPDGSFAYVTSNDGKTVTVIDTRTKSVITTFTTDQAGDGNQFRSVAVGPDGNLYITDSGDNTVYAVTVGDATAV